MTHDDYIKEGKKLITRAPDLIYPPSLLQIEETYKTVDEIMKEYLREEYVCGKPCNLCCIESFGVNIAEESYIKHYLVNTLSNNQLKKIKQKASDNIHRMLMIGKTVSPDGKEVNVGKILKAVEQRRVIMRCPVLKDADKYEDIDIKIQEEKTAEKIAKKRGEEYSPIYEDKDKKLPENPVCLLGDHKPISCRIYGVANELSYIRNDIGEKLVYGVCPNNLKVNDDKEGYTSHRFIPLFFLLKDEGGGHLSVLKYVLSSGLNILSAIIDSDNLKKKGIIQ